MVNNFCAVKSIEWQNVISEVVIAVMRSQGLTHVIMHSYSISTIGSSQRTILLFLPYYCGRNNFARYIYDEQ